MEIDRVHQVWSCDIRYIPMAYGFMYLVAVIDWHSRVVLSLRMSKAMAPDFCVETLEEAFRRYGKPEIFNTDQGVQFTCEAFIVALVAQFEIRGRLSQGLQDRRRSQSRHRCVVQLLQR
jgi:putative transposase